MSTELLIIPKLLKKTNQHVFSYLFLLCRGRPPYLRSLNVEQGVTSKMRMAVSTFGIVVRLEKIHINTQHDFWQIAGLKN